MSLKLSHTHVFGICYSCEDWVRSAIGAEKRIGEEGFENFKSFGDWFYWWHYKNIDNRYPTRSNENTLDEMSKYREELIEDVFCLAKMIDERIMRLGKMEEQMKEVIERRKDETL